MAKVNEYIPIHFVGKRVAPKVNTGTETLVEQCHEETTNINKIIARYRQSGTLPEHREGMYADVSNVGELLEMKIQMQELRDAYELMPDVVKEKLPLADIENVTDESLREMFSVDNSADQASAGASQDEAQTMQNGPATEGGARQDQAAPPE